MRNRFNKKIVLLFLFLTIIAPMMKVDALVPVTYTCCNDYTFNDGIQLDNFEKVTSNGFQLDNFENLSNWTIGGTGALQQVDTINFIEGIQSLKLIATNGNRAYSDKAINNNFSNTNNFAIWIYVYDTTTFDHATIFFTSTGTSWTKYFYDSIYMSGGFKTGWNKLIIDKNSFVQGTSTNENWNNIMNRIRISVTPAVNQNTNVSLDDLRFGVPNDWIVGGTGASIEGDIVNFKEGQQGLKLIATNGNTAYIDKIINSNFSTTKNFAVWLYVNNANNFSYPDIYFTSDPTWNKFFHNDLIYKGIKTGWNKLVFNKNDFTNIGGESWNNNMVRIRLRIYPLAGKNVNVTFDDLRYDHTGKKAKLMIDFDDARTTAYTNAYPILSANNQSGVTFAITALIGTTGYMNLSNLRTLQNAGWDISSHTVHHVDLSIANDTTQISELNDSYDWLLANKFQKSAGFIAYPYGTFNDVTIDKVKKRYTLGRGTVPQSIQQHFTPEDDAIQYIQRVINVYNTTTVQSIKDDINDSINAKLMGILVFHTIVNSNPTTYDYLTTDLQKISDYIKSRSADIDVITYSDYVIPNINSFTPIINKTTRMYSNGSSVLITKNKYDEYMPNMTIKPLSDSIDINITIYNETGGQIKFNESSPNNNLQVSYTIGDRIPNQVYNVKIYWANGTQYQNFNVLANSTGYINYNSTGFGDARYQEINNAGMVDTTFTVTLPVGYTFLRFNASNPSVTNLNADGQNSSQPMFNITNNGNINQSFMLNLNDVVNNVTTYADLSNNFSIGKIEINTSNTTIIPNLIPGSSQNIWIIVDANKAPTTNVNRILMINNN